MKSVCVSLSFAIILLSCKKQSDTELAKDEIISSGTTYRNVATSVVQWQKCFGNNLDQFGYAVAKGGSGYLVAGTINTADDAYISYYDRITGLVKSQIHGGSKYEHVKGVVNTHDGGFLVVGSTSSTEIEGYQGSGYNIMLIKFSALGDKEWIKALGIDNQQPLSIIKTGDGGYGISGYAESHVLFIKLDQYAMVEWQTTYLHPGSKADVGYSIVETPNAYVIAGRTLDINNNADLLMVSINKSDHTSLGQKIGTSNNSEIGFGIAHSSVTGDFVITGRKDNDLLTVKFNGQLNSNIQKTFGGTGIDWGRSIIATAEGYLIVGQTDSRNGDIISSKGGIDFWALRIDNNINKISSHNLGGNRDDAGFNVIIDGDGFIGVGNTKSNGGDVSGNNGGSDMWLVKFKF